MSSFDFEEEETIKGVVQWRKQSFNTLEIQDQDKISKYNLINNTFQIAAVQIQTTLIEYYCTCSWSQIFPKSIKKILPLQRASF